MKAIRVCNLNLTHPKPKILGYKDIPGHNPKGACRQIIVETHCEACITKSLGFDWDKLDGVCKALDEVKVQSAELSKALDTLDRVKAETIITKPIEFLDEYIEEIG